MKKIFVITLISLFLIFVLSPPIYAATTETILVEEPSVNTGGLWHIEDGSRVYVFMKYTSGESIIETGSFSNSGYPEYDYSLYTYWDGFKEDNFSFPNTDLTQIATISNPNPSIYDKFVVEIIANMTLHVNDSPTFKTIATYNEVVNDVRVELENWESSLYKSYFDYSHITLLVDGEPILTSRNNSVNPIPGTEVNPNFEDCIFGVRMYWETTTIADEIDPNNTDDTEDPWEALPNTTGSPSNPIGDWGTVSDISVVNQSVSFSVNYNGTEYPVTPFLVEGDLDFINNSNDILYYSDHDTGDRMLYFNFGDTLDSAILAARSFSTVNVWKGEALWNLTQNEVKVTDVLTVYNYIPEVDSDGNVYSYFYMPDVPIDNLISVSAVLAYRYWDDGILGIGDEQPGEIQYKTVAAVSGESTSVNPSWVETTYRTAYITAAVASVATVAGVIPGYGWAIAGACFLVGGLIQAADVNEWFAYDIDQIQRVIPGISLTNEINNYISESSGEDQFSSDTDKLYKLHLATLEENHDDVEIMSNLSNVTQVVWETDGEIFVVNEDNIDNVQWGGPGTLEPEDNGLGIPDAVIYIFIGIGGLYLFNKMELAKKPGLVLIIAAAVVYILHYLGIISWFR
ncbi:MAG: hypothetical protein JEZ05_08255 [Tenericutes bacterium]|nr:hypothetical protein [Mycoplasmatota bacterium]